MEKGWEDALKSEMELPYFKQLMHFVTEERAKGIIYPPESAMFNAFEKTPYANVKVIILGQDPYHQPMQAHGLSFSVKESIRIPPSLKNIYKELKSDLGLEIPASGNLENWATQGVLLLNTVLSVREGAAGSHQNKGWEQFTDAVIRLLSDKQSGLVFLLWGRYAHSKEKLIDTSKHYLLKAAHPSPLSAYQGFYGCKHFSQTNKLLEASGKKPINWSVTGN